MTTKQGPLYLLTAGIIVAAIYFAPTVFQLAVQTVGRAMAAIHGAPAVKAPVAERPTAPPPPPTPESMISAAVLGKWQANSMVANRGNCGMNLEVTPDATAKDQLSGFMSMRCFPPMVPFFGHSAAQAKHSMNEFAPVSVILSGVVKDQSVQFHADKSIAGGCAITSAAATPFGTKQLAIQWKDGCGDGQMILRR
jgi:hypothetical protein